MSKKRVTDKTMREAAQLAADDMLRGMPEPEDCDHEFSPEFMFRMEDVLSGDVTAQGRSAEPAVIKKPVRSRWRLAGSIAAVVALLAAFGGVAYANDWMGIRTIFFKPVEVPHVVVATNSAGEKIVVAEFGTEAATTEAQQKENTEKNGIPEAYKFGTYSYSLVGAVGGPEQMGVEEWRSWKEYYIYNIVPLEGIDLPCSIIPGDNIDKVYGAFNDDMKAKLTEICDKYGLKLHPDVRDTYSYKELCKELGYVPITEPDKDVFTATYYTDGAFMIETAERWEGGCWIRMDYNIAGVLHTFGGATNWPDEERVVYTDDGVQITVLEVQDDDNAAKNGDGYTMLITPLDRGHLTIRVSIQKPESEITRFSHTRALNEDELQEFISRINFSAMGRQDEAVLEKYRTYAENYDPSQRVEYGSAVGDDVQRLDTTLQLADAEIRDLVYEYYRAVQDGDADALKAISVYPQWVDDADVAYDAGYIEEAKVSKVYMIPSVNPGEWMAFARYEYRFSGIDNPFAYVSSFYVVTEDDGSLKLIFPDVLSPVFEEDDSSLRDKNIILSATKEYCAELADLIKGCYSEYQNARANNSAFDEFMTEWSHRPRWYSY